MFVKSGREETTYLEGEKIPSIRYHILKGSGFVKDGFSTRRGGVSKGQFSSMNFSVKMGDNEENVQENFRIFLAEHGFKNPVMADQVHGKTIRLVSREDVGKNVYKRTGCYPGNHICGLCSALSGGSGKSCDWTGTFRLERHDTENRSRDSRKNEGNVWNKSGRCVGSNRPVHLCELL